VNAQWHGFFAAQVGATAALTGLLFVALSVNIARIMQFSWLPSRAALTIVVLLGALLESSLALFPPPLARLSVGATMVIGIVVYASAWCLSDLLQKIPSEWRSHPDYRRARIVNLSAMQFATIPPLVGAALLLGGGNGYSWLAMGILFSLAYGILSSWILLVEILR
jgi:hypothetical protein